MLFLPKEIVALMHQSINKILTRYGGNTYVDGQLPLYSVTFGTFTFTKVDTLDPDDADIPMHIYTYI